MYIPQIPVTLAQARALAMKIGDAHSNPLLWDEPTDNWMLKANKPQPYYRITGIDTLYPTLNELVKEQGLKMPKCKQSVKTGEEIYPGHVIQQVLAIDDKIIKIMPPLSSDSIKIR